jgi:hypothetical protein
MNSFALRDCGGSIGIVCSKMLLHGKMRFPHRRGESAEASRSHAGMVIAKLCLAISL